MNNIIIRKCAQEDEEEILNICYKTGYMGEEMQPTNKFNDVELFGYLFCHYYVWYEINNCFVAVDKNTRKVVGYILGTLNSKKQEKAFKYKMIYKIAFRILFSTIWKNHESFQTVMHFIKNLDLKDDPKDLYEKYPAHLHINILPEYQHSGIGNMLIDTFETHVKSHNVKGIHLRTSSYNEKAVPFYKKKGYKVIHENESKLWKDVYGLRNIIFAKEIV